MEQLADKFGHKLPKLADKLEQLRPGFLTDQLSQDISSLPNLVNNRYSTEQPDHFEVAEHLVCAQRIAGACAQAISMKPSIELFI